MTSTSYLNSPVKSCRTCVHHLKDNLGPEWSYCSRFHIQCRIATRMGDLCGRELKEWSLKLPPLPRRSLWQWLGDLIWH